MEYIFGKQTGRLDRPALVSRLQGYSEVWIDLGTGDGRYVEQLAKKNPDLFLIGIDACRENLSRVSGRAPSNALFLIANAEALPSDLFGFAGRITVNFPWGSLLEGLLQKDSLVASNLRMIAGERANLEIRLNDTALCLAGLIPETGQARVVEVLERSGFELKALQRLDGAALRAFPSSWARRVASGGKALSLSLAAR